MVGRHQQAPLCMCVMAIPSAVLLGLSLEASLWAPAGTDCAHAVVRPPIAHALLAGWGPGVHHALRCCDDRLHMPCSCWGSCCVHAPIFGLPSLASPQSPWQYHLLHSECGRVCCSLSVHVAGADPVCVPVWCPASTSADAPPGMLCVPCLPRAMALPSADRA